MHDCCHINIQVYKKWEEIIFPFFFIIYLFFLLKIVFFIKYEIFINKKNEMKNIILFIFIILCIAQICIIKAQQHKITDMERTLWVKEQVIIKNRR